MELTLNLFWLLLVVPALWLWRQARFARLRGRPEVRPSAMVLGCLLLLLFPVVSATDDLQAMRPEIEESATSDLARASHHASFSASTNSRAGAALPAAQFRIFPQFAILTIVLPHTVAQNAATVTAVGGERGPPAFLLG